MKKVIYVQAGRRGLTGESAYEEWLSQGNTGSEEDFLAYLKGEKGDKGDQGNPGKDAAEQIPDPGEIFNLLFENALI